MFTLEVLKARHGDCLIIHHGSRSRPRHVLIDGGPHHVFKRFLKPRLIELREEAGGASPLAIDLVMVSHMDQDHIKGILDLFDDIADAMNDDQAPLVEIGALWQNAFPDLVGETETDGNEAETAALSLASADDPEIDLGLTGHTKLVLSSVREARKLRDDARRLAVDVNPACAGNLVLGGENRKLGSLALKVIGPARTEAEALKVTWKKQVAKILAKEAAKRAAAAGRLDRSVFNLASIVVLAEVNGKHMLLTGDARGDTILESLESEGLLDEDGKLHVDLLKMPHHGSDRNVDDDFFQRVTADHYVLSGDGRHHNPELETFRMLFRARERGDPYTLHLTYTPEDMQHEHPDYPAAELQALFDQAEADGVPFSLNTPAAGETSMMIPLIDAT